MLSIPKDQAIAQALARHEAGESLRDIAPSLGISHVRLRAILLGEVPDQYKAAQSDALVMRIAEADEALEIAPDALNIARAREIAKFARWDAERRLPHLFGQRQEVHHTHDISDDLRQISERRRTRDSVTAAQQASIIDVTPTNDA